MKNIILILLIISARFIYSQRILDSTSANFDFESRFYSPKKLIRFSELLNRLGANNFTNEIILIDSLEVRYHKFVQLHNGIPIVNSEYSIREINDSIISATGLISTELPNNLSLAISKEEALQLVLSEINFDKYKWQDTSYENSIKRETNDTTSTYYPNPRLFYYKINPSIFDSENNYKLLYSVPISAQFYQFDSIYIDSVYLVDAISGMIFKRFSPKLSCFQDETISKTNLRPVKLTSTTEANFSIMLPLCQQDCMATNPSLNYYGNQTIFTEKFLNGLVDCTHRLKDVCTGTYLYVKKEGHSSFPGEKDFRSNSNTWASNSGNPPDQVGATTLWSLEKSHDFFRLWLQQISFNNQNAQIKAVVGRTNSSSYYKTGWHLVNDYMTVGRFNSTLTYECSLDIIGHELSHGVGDKICSMNLDGSIDKNSEEGAISEGYGDIFGQGVEHFVNFTSSVSGSIDDFYHGSNMGAFVARKQRNLANPNLTGNPDTYLGLNWVASWDGNFNNPDFAHTNSTVLSHWFFLLANGGNGTNDNSDDFCVIPIGQYNSLRIAHRSLSFLVGTSKTFNDARNATIQAAISLFGNNSHELAQVFSAWQAVGVGPPSISTAIPIFVGNKTDNISRNYNYNNQVTHQNYIATGGASYNVSSNVEVVFLSNVDILGCTYDGIIAPACNGAGARFSNGFVEESNETENIKTLKSESTLLNVDKICAIEIFPNPSTGMFKISPRNCIQNIREISLQNTVGKIIYHTNEITKSEINIDLSNASNGLYVLKVFYEDKVLVQKLIKH